MMDGNALDGNAGNSLNDELSPNPKTNINNDTTHNNSTNNLMDSDTLPTIKGVLYKDQTIITNKEVIHQLELKGYGERVQGKFFLKSFETLYLFYSNKLSFFKPKKKMNFDSLMKICIKYDDEVLTKFLIYRDLRNRGYVIKNGFGFGPDFIVYERGHFQEKGAKYLIFALSEGRPEKIRKLQDTVDGITQMGKEPIIGVIDRRGEIIYYKISRMFFPQNKQN
jgi:tRNA-intron endonuclease